MPYVSCHTIPPPHTILHTAHTILFVPPSHTLLALSIPCVLYPSHGRDKRRKVFGLQYNPVKGALVGVWLGTTYSTQVSIDRKCTPVVLISHRARPVSWILTARVNAVILRISTQPRRSPSSLTEPFLAFKLLSSPHLHFSTVSAFLAPCPLSPPPITRLPLPSWCDVLGLVSDILLHMIGIVIPHHRQCVSLSTYGS